jgi:DNA-binding NarL/FixJ family response regulator
MAAGRAEPEDDPVPLDLHPIRVVIADDHAGYRAVLVRTLERHGATVVSATADGLTAIDAARSLDVDVCVVDLDLPGVSATAVARELRLSIPPIPTVVVSAYGDRELIAATLRSGADGFVVKGGSSRQLVDAVARSWRAGREPAAPPEAETRS